MGNKQILMASSYSQGGIATVVDNFLNNGLDKHVKFFTTYIQASTLLNWLIFPLIWIKFSFNLLFDRNIKIVHLLSADRGSFLRKSLLLLTAKLSGKKVIFNVHSGPKNLFYNDENPFIKPCIKFILDKADIILVLSSQWKENIESKCSNKNIRILYNPISLKEVNSGENNTVNVLFMGRLGQRKGAYDLVEAAKLIKNPNVKINMYGDGEVKEIKSIVKENNLENIVNVMGWISGKDVEKAYRNSDIFILPSYNEGLPMSILEAMSYGLPVISTTVGGIPEQVVDNVSGFLINAGDVSAIAEKIELMAQDKSLINKMGLEGRKIVGEKFETGVILKELELIYDGFSGKS